MNRPLIWRWGFSWRPRMWGWGFCLQRDRTVYFSERYGFRRVYRVGRWALTFFPPKGAK